MTMADAKVILKAENNIKAGLDSAKKDLQGFEDITKKVGDTIKAAFAVTAIAASVKKLGSVALDCFNEFAEGERRSNQLKIALDNSNESYVRMTALIESVSEKTLSSKDDVEELVSELASLGKSDSEIEAITEASVNLSNITGKGLKESFQQLNSTYSGSVDELGKMIPELKSLTKEQLASGEAVQLVNNKFGGLSETLANQSISQKIKNINDKIGDMKQGIGEVIAIEFTPMIDRFDDALAEISDSFVGVFTTLVAIFENLPEVSKLSFNLILDIIETTFSWSGLKTIFISLTEYIAQTLSLALTSLPGLFWDVVKLMFNPVKALGDYMADTLGKALKLDFKDILSPGEFLKGLMIDQADLAGSLVSDVVSLVSKQATNIKDLGKGLSTIYDDIDWSGFKDKVDAVIAPSLAKFSKNSVPEPAPVAADPLSIGLSTQFDNPTQKEFKYEVPSLSFDYKTPPVSNQEEPSILGSMKDAFSSTFSGVWDSIKGSGKTDEDLLGGLTGQFGQLSSALSPLTEILFSSNPLFAALMPIIEGALNILQPAISEVIDPLMSAFTMVGETLGIALLPVLDAISPIFSLLGQILQAVLLPVIELLSPFINLIALGFQTLSPIIALVAKGLTILMSPVQFVADLFGWLGEWIQTLGANIGIAIYNLTHWFDQKSYKSGPDSFSTDAFSGLADKLAALDNIGETSMAASATTSATTASQSASYSGGNTITINIYQQAPVVGDGGMTEFARMIRSEFAALDYYNN
jgi:hypothetical protein